MEKAITHHASLGGSESQDISASSAWYTLVHQITRSWRELPPSSSLMDMGYDLCRNGVIVRDFNTVLSSRDRVSRQKLNKETQALNDIFHQVDLTDVYRAFHSKATGYTFFSNAHETFWATNQALINLRKLNPYQTYFPITMLWD